MSELGIIQDGALLLSNGLVEYAGPTRRLENLAKAKGARVIDATGMTILPGLIDPDCRLIPPNLETAGGKKAEEAALGRLAQMIRGGTLAMDSVAGPAGTEGAELKGLRLNHHLRAKYPNLISTYAPKSPGTTGLSKLVKQEALQLIEFRAGEQPWEPAQSQAWRERSAAYGFLMKGRAEELRNCENLPVEQVCFSGEASDREIDWAAKQDWVLSASPLPSLRQGVRSSQWRRMAESGVALALSTGADGAAGASSMQLMIALASTEMGLTIAEAITAATINAAHALGIHGIAGSLEPGKRADLLILDVPDHHEISYHLGINLVAKIILHGKVFFEQMELAWPGA